MNLDKEELLDKIGNDMADADTKQRMVLLEALGCIHQMGLTAFMLLEAVDRKDFCPKTMLEGYFEAFQGDVKAGVEATCRINGVVFNQDLNKDLREELLNELHKKDS